MAATFPGAIDRHVRSLRAHSLQRTAEENRRKFARRFVGKTVEVLIENEKNSSGWTSQYLWFEAASGAGAFPRRSLARFRVTGSQNGILQGEIADK
jgi:tRNA A37 methylthiotransferase MiaB